MSAREPAEATPRAPRWAWIGLLLILTFGVWLRGHTFGPLVRDRLGVSLWPVTGAEGEPLDCDEAAYAYMGRRIARGDRLYRDLTENKPPLGYWIYTLAVALGGANEATIRIMPIPMVLATIVLVWWIALRLGGPGAACLSALLYAIASTDPYLFGNGANLEHPLNLFAVASLALMVQSLTGARRRGPAIAAAGACLGLATLVKQVAVTHLVLYAATLLAMPPDGGRRMALRRLRLLGALGAGFASVWAVTLLILGLRGVLADAYDDVVRYAGAMVLDMPPDPHAPPFLVRWLTGNADPDGRLPWPFGRTTYLVWWGTGTWPLWASAVPALGWLGLGPRASLPRRLVVGWTLSAWVQVALTRLFWQHYYLLPVPGVALVLGLTAGDLARGMRSARRSRWLGAAAEGLALATLLLACAATAAIQARDYLAVEPEQLTVRYKGGGQWVALRDLGRALAARVRGWPSPHLYVWGWQSPLYIYSGLDSVTPEYFANDFLKRFAGRDHPAVRPRIERILRDLRARQPELIFAGDVPFPALRALLFEHYRPARLMTKGQPSIVVPDGRGLWVSRRHYAELEARPPPPGRR